jgi:hypothetical protein
MRSSAQRPKATQRATSVKSPTPDRTRFVQNRETSSLLHLQSAIGNQAVLQLLQNKTADLPEGLIHPQRKVGTSEDKYEQEVGQMAEYAMRTPQVQRQPAKDPVVQAWSLSEILPLLLKSAKPSMPELHERAIKRADRIGKLQERVIRQLKAASKRLTSFSTNYEPAYKNFVGTLKKADKVDQLGQEALDLVLGVMIGAAIGAINPGAYALRLALGTAAKEVTEAAKQSLRQLALSKSKELAEGAISEGFEAIAANSMSDILDSQAPSDTAQLGGHDVQFQLKKALHQLSDLIDNFPNLLPLQRTQTRLATLAMSASGSNDLALLKSIVSFDERSETIVQTMSASIIKPFDDLEKAIMAQPLKTPHEIERNLWIEWTSKLTPPYDQLNYLVVRERLKDVGLGYLLFEGTVAPMTGTWSGERIPPHDTQRIVLNAQIAWLQAHGIPAKLKNPNGYSNAQGIAQLAKLGQSLNFLEQNVPIGSRGTFLKKSDFEGWVLIRGKKYPFSGQVPPIAGTGTKVVVHDIFPRWQYLVYLAEKYMNTDDYNVQEQLRHLRTGLKVKWDTYRDYPPYEYP